VAANDLPVGVFVVEEMTGEKRRIELCGRALPYRPFTLSGTQRAEFTWYQGNGIASVQVLGPEEEPSNPKGYWKDRFLGQVDPMTVESPGLVPVPTSFATLNGAAVPNVERLVWLFDDVRRKGQLLSVQWLSINRHGILSKFSASWHTYHDVEWEMEFKWSSQGEVEGDMRMVATDQDVTEVAQTAVKNAIALRQSAVTSFPRASDFTDAVNAKLDGVRSTVASLLGAAQGVADGSLDAINTARRAVSLLTYVIATARDTWDEVKARCDENCYGLKGDITDSHATMGQVARAARSNRHITRAARVVMHDAARARRRMAAMVSPDLAVSVQARQDQDLRELAVQHYGDASAWRTIAAYNGLHGSKLRAGQVVMVPKARTGAGQR
jgi:nucleoid-associated protein YgaU